jgi:hypothetical protein
MATTIFIRLASRVRQHTDPIVQGWQEWPGPVGTPSTIIWHFQLTDA